MPFCVSCGKENKNSAKFCIGCGKALQNPENLTPLVKVSDTKPESGNKKPGLSKNIIVGIAALLLIVLTMYLVLNGKSEDKIPAANTVTVPDNTPQPEKAEPVNSNNDQVPVENVEKNENAQSKPAENSNVVKQVIEQYYTLGNNGDCLAINAFYEPVLENYYNQKNLNRSEVLSDCVSYRERWPYGIATVDYSSLEITGLNDGGSLATYQLAAAVKKKETDEWKNFNLLITVHFTGNLKIKSIYEIKK